MMMEIESALLIELTHVRINSVAPHDDALVATILRAACLIVTACLGVRDGREALAGAEVLPLRVVPTQRLIRILRAINGSTEISLEALVLSDGRRARVLARHRGAAPAIARPSCRDARSSLRVEVAGRIRGAHCHGWCRLPEEGGGIRRSEKDGDCHNASHCLHL